MSCEEKKPEEEDPACGGVSDRPPIELLEKVVADMLGGKDIGGSDWNWTLRDFRKALDAARRANVWDVVDLVFGNIVSGQNRSHTGHKSAPKTALKEMGHGRPDCAPASSNGILDARTNRLYPAGGWIGWVPSSPGTRSLDRCRGEDRPVTGPSGRQGPRTQRDRETWQGEP